MTCSAPVMEPWSLQCFGMSALQQAPDVWGMIKMRALAVAEALRFHTCSAYHDVPTLI